MKLNLPLPTPHCRRQTTKALITPQIHHTQLFFEGRRGEWSPLGKGQLSFAGVQGERRRSHLLGPGDQPTASWLGGCGNGAGKGSSWSLSKILLTRPGGAGRHLAPSPKYAC